MHQPVAEAAPMPVPPKPTFATKLRKLVLQVLRYLALIWIVFMGYFWFNQEQFLFHPQPLKADAKVDVIHTSEVYIDVTDAKLHALYLHQPDSHGIVLFLHGNTGNVQTWFTHADFWLSTGYDVLMPDYRGFGKSTGHIGREDELHLDVLKVWNFIEPKYKGKKHVIYGRSLGTGLAAKLATEVQTDLLVLVSPYENMTAMARHYFPLAPGFILRYPLNTSALLPSIQSPILLLHGTEDALIPIDQSRHLQKRNKHARLVEIPGAAHDDIQEFTLFIDTLKRALQAL